MMAKRNGYTLIEVLVALALLSIVGVAISGALNTAVVAYPIVEERITAEDLAERQIEFVLSQNYDATGDPPEYTLLGDTELPEGYAISLSVELLRVGLQKITVIVTRLDKVVADLEAYKLQ